MKTIVFGAGELSIEDVAALADRASAPALAPGDDFARRIDAGSEFLDRAIATSGSIYGVTTGYGDSCGKEVPQESLFQLPVHLTRFHGCGMGERFDDRTTRAILAVRLSSLCRGFSGVSMDLVRALHGLLAADVLPRIPQEGSVGASGDLTPLSYVGAVLIGERDAKYQGREMPAVEALGAAGLSPIRLRPKEGLALMNGTAAMTAVACLAFDRAAYLAALACRLTAMASIALKGNAYHFDERLFAVKPHPGQTLAAANVRADLGGARHPGIRPERLQDPYSIRCAPHVIGVLMDALPFIRSTIEIELNSANDNPIIDPVDESIMHGGHFYGGHIAFCMDSLKNLVANLADLLDRQLAVVVDEKLNRGLPPNLTGADAHSFNHGFKAVQIAVSAWTAEALKNTMPASVFSRSTECHNQDKVSMGTIAARDCIRVLELTEQVVAANLLAMSQAIWLRLRDSQLKPEKVAGVKETMDQVRAVFEPLVEDRPLEPTLRDMVRLIRGKHWRLPYGAEPALR